MKDPRWTPRPRDGRLEKIEARLSSLEKAVYGRLEKAVFPKVVSDWRSPPAAGPSAWIECPNDGCQRSSYKQPPACMRCAGYDPRTGEGMGDRP